MVAPVYVAPLVGELAFCIWLMVRGVKTANLVPEEGIG
jgi:hypothetical protein